MLTSERTRLVFLSFVLLCCLHWCTNEYICTGVCLYVCTYVQETLESRCWVSLELELQGVGRAT